MTLAGVGQVFRPTLAEDTGGEGEKGQGYHPEDSLGRRGTAPRVRDPTEAECHYGGTSPTGSYIEILLANREENQRKSVLDGVA